MNNTFNHYYTCFHELWQGLAIRVFNLELMITKHEVMANGP